MDAALLSASTSSPRGLAPPPLPGVARVPSLPPPLLRAELRRRCSAAPPAAPPSLAQPFIARRLLSAQARVAAAGSRPSSSSLALLQRFPGEPDLRASPGVLYLEPRVTVLDPQQTPPPLRSRVRRCCGIPFRRPPARPAPSPFIASSARRRRLPVVALLDTSVL